MGRLHNPGPGEILDRLTILALKIVYGTQAGRDTTHWKAEQETLADTFWLGTPGTLTVRVRGLQWMELAAVNAAIWQAEDEMRGYRDSFIGDAPIPQDTQIAAGLCGCRIQYLNDRRAELVTLINSNAGVDHPSDKV